MGTLSTPPVNLRSEIAETQGLRRSIKPGLRRVAFANLVTNGDFATDITDWTDTSVGTGTSSFGTNEASVTTTTTPDYGRLRQNISVTHGWRYSLSVDLDGALVQIGNTENNTNGIYQSTQVTATEVHAFTAPNEIIGVAGMRLTVGTGTFDNVHLWEADPSDDAPWLRLPAGYQLGDAGRVVRDGLELMDGDFTEILTGIGDNLQAFIKPTTAPGVSTKFNVWCAPQ